MVTHGARLHTRRSRNYAAQQGKCRSESSVTGTRHCAHRGQIKANLEGLSVVVSRNMSVWKIGWSVVTLSRYVLTRTHAISAFNGYLLDVRIQGPHAVGTFEDDDSCTVCTESARLVCLLVQMN